MKKIKNKIAHAKTPHSADKEPLTAEINNGAPVVDGDILVVDDSPANLKMVAELIGTAGYTVRVADSGEAALRSVKEKTPTLILLDVKMPDIDGYEVGRQLQSNESTRSIPIIFISALEDEDSKIEAFNAGGVDYICKPFHAEELIARIKTHLTLRNLQMHLKDSVVERTIELENTNQRLQQEISEHKQAEEALLKSRQLYQNIINYSPIGIYQSSWEGRFIMANTALAQMLGYESVNEILSKNIGEDVYFQRIDRDRLIQEYAVQGVTADVEVQWKKQDATPIWVHLIAHAVKDEAGKIKYFEGFVTDITERKRAEKELTILVQSIKSISESVSITDTNDNIIFVNKSFEETYGYTNDEMVGKNINIIRSQKTPPYIGQEILPTTLRGGWHGELWNRKKDGTEFPISLSTSIVKDQAGNITALIGVAEDITERKRAEQESKRSEERFQTIFDQAPLGIALIDSLTGRIYEVNTKFANIAGRTREEMITIDWMSITHPDDVQEDLNNMKRLNAGEITGFQLNKRYIKPDGSIVWISMTIAPINVEEKTHPRHLCMIEDITERKNIEEALQKSNSFNALLVQTMPFGIDVVDEQRNILYMSDTLKNLVGENFLDRRCWATYRDEKTECPNCPLHREINFGNSQTLEVTNMFGGKTFQIIHTGLVYDGKIAMLEVFQDVTEQKKLQERLIQSTKMESIGTLASGIAHDFNNILGIILAYTSLLKRMKDEPEKFAQSVNEITTAVHRGANLVKQILTFARKTEVVIGPLDINILIKEVVKMLKETLPSSIEIMQYLHTPMPFINADATQVHQALLNICVNARDAMPQGGTLTVKSEIVQGQKLQQMFPTIKGNDYMCVSIADNGIGMDEKIISQIFDPFFTTKEKGKGTGLGLAVVDGIMKSHNGIVDVHSTLGKGTTFYLYFPIPEKNINSESRLGESSEVIPGGNETILFVEDEEGLMKMVKQTLESYGYNVITATNGIEAVDMYSKFRETIALVVSDIGLPKLTGDQAFFKIHTMNPLVKVILVSGYLDANLKSELFKTGMKEFIEKPYDVDELLKKIRETLDRK